MTRRPATPGAVLVLLVLGALAAPGPAARAGAASGRPPATSPRPSPAAASPRASPRATALPTGDLVAKFNTGLQQILVLKQQLSVLRFGLVRDADCALVLGTADELQGLRQIALRFPLSPDEHVLLDHLLGIGEGLTRGFARSLARSQLLRREPVTEDFFKIMAAYQPAMVELEQEPGLMPMLEKASGMGLDLQELVAVLKAEPPPCRLRAREPPPAVKAFNAAAGRFGAAMAQLDRLERLTAAPRPTAAPASPTAAPPASPRATGASATPAAKDDPQALAQAQVRVIDQLTQALDQLLQLAPTLPLGEAERELFGRRLKLVRDIFRDRRKMAENALGGRPPTQEEILVMRLKYVEPTSAIEEDPAAESLDQQLEDSEIHWK